MSTSPPPVVAANVNLILLLPVEDGPRPSSHRPRASHCVALARAAAANLGLDMRRRLTLNPRHWPCCSVVPPGPSPAYDQNIHAASACAAHRSARRGSRRPAPPSDTGPYSAAHRLQSHGSLRPDFHALAQIWPGQPTVASAQIWLGTDLPRPDEAGGLVSAQIQPGSIVLDWISCPDPL
jgi:hypothetical protein